MSAKVMNDLEMLEHIASGKLIVRDAKGAYWLKLLKLRALGFIKGVIGPKNIKLTITRAGRNEIKRIRARNKCLPK